MDIIHNIYILDDPFFDDINIKFLSYLKKNKSIIKDMGVSIRIDALTSDQLNEIEDFLKENNIEIFPILVTDKKIYKGLHDIVMIYDTNIKSYHNHIYQQEQLKQQEILRNQQELYQRQQQIQKQQQKQSIIEDSDLDEQMHSYIANELQLKTVEKDDSMFNDMNNDNMMDSYRHMMSKRGTEKRSPFNNKLRSLENTKQSNDDNINMQDIIYNQLQNNVDKEDNIKHEIDDDEVINIDPSKIKYDEDDDPQDAILEKAYWNRVSETK